VEFLGLLCGSEAHQENEQGDDCVANNVNVTNRGFEYIAQMVAGNIATYAIPTYIGWGTANGSNASSVVLPAAGPGGVQGAGQWSDVGPYSESTEVRVKAASTTVTNNVAASGTVTTSFVGTITAASGETIGESFLTPGSTKPAVFSVVGLQPSTSSTSLTANTSGGVAGAYYQMDNEVILLSSTAVSNVWTIVRAQNGSTANIGKNGDCLTFGNIPGAGASNPSNGDMFAHAGFVGLTLNSGDSIQFTWQVNVTS
jgi:hypothetical protein